jgi:DNA replication protein DnaC
MKELHMQFAKQYADNFLKKKLTKGLIFFGNVGIGKTFATACIANQLMDNGRTVLVMNLGLYINKLKAGGWEEAEQDILKQVEQCDLVIIDDFGAEKGLDNDKSTWRAEKIYNLIDTRYRAEKPLIISTNLKFDKDVKKCELEENFKYQGVGRIRDRIADMCYPVRVVGENKRGMSEKEFLECIA